MEDVLSLSPSGRALQLGRLLVPLGTAARDDKATPGTIAAYESGASIFLQIHSTTPGTWRSIELT